MTMHLETAAPPVPRLYTVGYERRSVEELVKLLRDAEIGAVIDVRELPLSHKRGLSKTPLSRALADDGIHYVHAKFAGNPKLIRKQGGTVEDVLARYTAHLDENPEIVEAFATLVDHEQSDGRAVALMCFERDPAACHRGVLAERWRARRRGRVRHLGV